MTTAPGWDHEGRDWPNRPYSRFVEAGRLRWHVQVLGAGPPLLLLHGTGAATHSWRNLAPLLAQHFMVIAPDLPGHGFTRGRPPGGLAMPAMASAMAELLRALEVSPAVIAGHSAGAAIMARMVLDGLAAPQALIGLNAALLPFPGLGAKLFPAMARALFVNPFAPHFFARLARGPGEIAKFMLRSTGSHIDAAGIRFYEQLFATSGHCEGAIRMMADWDLVALKRDLPRLDAPLLLIHGEADAAIPVANAREAAALIGNAQIITIPRLGHLAHEERPEDIAALMRDFAEKAG